jgi:hypothetical protein
MRIHKTARWALPAITLVLLGASMLAKAQSTAVYACISFGSTTLPIATDPMNKGCPTGTSISLLNAISVGGSDPVSLLGTGARTGVPSLSALAISKSRDASTDGLLHAAETARVLVSVSIAIYEGAAARGATLAPAFNILLKDVIVTNWNWGASSYGTIAYFSESANLTFGEIEIIDNSTHQSVSWSTATP